MKQIINKLNKAFYLFLGTITKTLADPFEMFVLYAKQGPSGLPIIKLSLQLKNVLLNENSFV